MNQKMIQKRINYEIEIRDDSPTPYELTIQTQKIEIMRNFVKQLPDKYSILIDLRYFQELSYNEIAIEMDLPLGTVKAQLHRAREILLNLLREKKSDFLIWKLYLHTSLILPKLKLSNLKNFRDYTQNGMKK